MNKTYYFLLIIALISSCTTSSEGGGNILGLDFYPRQCNVVYTEFSLKYTDIIDGQTYYSRGEASASANPIEDLYLVVSTSSIDSLPKDTEWYYRCRPYEFHEILPITEQELDEHNTALENHMEEDYQNYLSKSTKSASATADYIQSWEYRTTGVTSLNITSNQTLFGQAPGNSLNEYFHLAVISENQIISYETNELIFGCSDNLNGMSISEWLSLKPMAQPTLFLQANEVPTELPVTAQFTVQLTTTTGLELTSTTKAIPLTE